MSRETTLFDIIKLYRDPLLAKRIVRKIHETARYLDKDILIMHVCGTHEWTITHYGIRSLLPANIEVRAGPGCPVCITPASDIDFIIRLALEDNICISVYGDMSRAKGVDGMSLEDAKSMGADIRVVYSVQDAFETAIKERGRKFIFFGVGFDTAAPGTAFMVLKKVPDNLSVFSSYKYIPPAVGALLSSPDLEVDGLLNPGHSSTVTGMAPYKEYFDKYPRPMVFGGFEPIDVLLSIYMLLRQIKSGEPKMENEYVRSVTWEGNKKAMDTVFKVFDLLDGHWRGFGMVPFSGFEFKKSFSNISAKELYGFDDKYLKDGFIPGARCSDIIKGKIDPVECPLYMKDCNPDNPRGPPMVSAEGACRIWAEHRVVAKLKCKYCEFR